MIFGELQRLTLTTACLAMSVTSLSNLAFPKLIGKLIDRMNATDRVSNKRFFLMTLAVLAMGAIGSWVRTYCFNLASFSVSRRLRTKLYRCMSFLLLRILIPWSESFLSSGCVFNIFVTAGQSWPRKRVSSIRTAVQILPLCFPRTFKSLPML